MIKIVELVDNPAWCCKILKYFIFIWIHILISIQIKDNQILNDNIIPLSWWLHDINSKKYLKISKK
jgi:hypothetical protein